jgi:hypothetical protein
MENLVSRHRHTDDRPPRVAGPEEPHRPSRECEDQLKGAVRPLDGKHPIVRIMVGRHVEAVFHHVAGRWSERLYMSREQFRYLMRRAEDLSHLSYEEQTAIYYRDDRGHKGQGEGHRVRLIGNEPFGKAYRSEWNGVPLCDIPGYRVVYRFGRYTLGEDTLFRALDALRDHGITKIQLDVLRQHAKS